MAALDFPEGAALMSGFRLDTCMRPPWTRKEIHMTQALRTQVDAQTALPLVRAIAREVRERTQLLESLEARAAGGERGPRIESELSLQRRELRACERELSRYGYGIDARSEERRVGKEC